MANNIYIGMRYVPLFDGTYNSEKVYEPLTVVEYNNSSYTSKRQVPAGVLPTNTEYWARSGDFNAQYNELSERIDGVETTAESAETTANNASTLVNNLNTTVTQINRDLGEVRDTVDEQTAKKLLSNCRFVLIGDSYAEGYTGSGGSVPANGWPAQMKTILGLANDACFISYRGGAGFSQQTNGGGFAGLLSNLVESVTSPETIDYVVCAGGYNDHSQLENDVMIGMREFYRTARTNFPNAKIMFGMIGWDGHVNIQNDIVKTLAVYKKGQVTYAPELLYLSGVEHSLYNIATLMDTDVKHPNATGNKNIATNIINAISSGYASVFGSYSLNFVPAEGWSTSNPTDVRCVFKNGRLYIDLRKIQLTRSDYVTTSGNAGRLVVGSIPNLLKSGVTTGNTSWISDVILVEQHLDSGDTFRYVRCDIGFFENDLYVTFYNLNPAGNGWENINTKNITLSRHLIEIDMHA